MSLLFCLPQIAEQLLLSNNRLCLILQTATTSWATLTLLPSLSTQLDSRWCTQTRRPTKNTFAFAIHTHRRRRTNQNGEKFGPNMCPLIRTNSFRRILYTAVCLPINSMRSMSWHFVCNDSIAFNYHTINRYSIGYQSVQPRRPVVGIM